MANRYTVPPKMGLIQGSMQFPDRSTVDPTQAPAFPGADRVTTGGRNPITTAPPPAFPGSQGLPGTPGLGRNS